MGRAREGTLRAVERVKHGATPKAAAEAEGVQLMTVYASLRRHNVDWEHNVASPVSPASRAAMAAAQYERHAAERDEERRRQEARAVVRAAGKPLLRRVVDRAQQLLNEGLGREYVVSRLRGLE